MTVDDSALLSHARVYDPAKARAYYLRTRHLKGRRPAGSTPPSGGRPQSGGGTSAHIRASRRAELQAQKAALEKRLDRLREVLAEKVKAAKLRSGIKETPKKDPKEAADTNSKNKKGKPLTAKQKADKRKASKEQYEKEKGTTLSQDVQQLQDQIKDIRAKIESAIKDARQKSARSQSQTASKGR